MRLRLAGGVVTPPGLAAWLPNLQPVMDDVPPGAAVALGPADASDGDVQQAVTALNALVTDGGEVAAGAGVDLGDGFRSARLEGARGDQRDAVFAALKVLGVENADRLGDRAGFLVALFGPSVTKRVGAAAAHAISEGRWAALHLATAASDLLGPEQLERVLALEGAGLVGGVRPSVLAANLHPVLAPMSGPRRLELLLDLWGRVAQHHENLARRERLLATQGRQNRLGSLRKRRRHYEEETLAAEVRSAFMREPSLLEAARWTRTEYGWIGELNRIVKDAFAATALLHTAIAVSDHGLEEGLARSETMIRAAAEQHPDEEISDARTRVPGLTGLPARPGCYVRDIAHRLDTKRELGSKDRPYITQRLAHARDYALLTVIEMRDLLTYARDLPPPATTLHAWAAHPQDLGTWRERVGYPATCPPSAWERVPVWMRHNLGLYEALGVRLEARPDADPVEVEVVGDLLWCVDLLDAFAKLHGHETAELREQGDSPFMDYDPKPEAQGLDRLPRRYASIASAVSGVAQLIALGGTAQRGVRTWDELVDGLLADTRIAETMRDDFTVPAALAELDATIVPGSDGVRFVVARNARMLADWSNYMGNCIAQDYYVEEGTAGKIALTALYGRDGRIQANAELLPRGLGWRIAEIQGRFNEKADQALEKCFRDWIATIRSSFQAEVVEDDDTAPPPSGKGPRRPRLLDSAGPALREHAARAWADEMDASSAQVLAVLAPSTTGPDAALTTLRRLGSARLAGACLTALSDDAVDVLDLWELTGIRPMRTALSRLDPSLRERFDQLDLLTGAGPLPGSLRKLVRTPQVAPAYSMGLVGLRLRATLGRLVLDGDEAVIHSLGRRPSVPMLCAFTVHITCCDSPAFDLAPVAAPRVVNVPGYPASALNEEPWLQAFSEARELGAETSDFWDRIASHGLRIPSAWGGWPALWSRAHSAARKR